jgi:hypothetical protein
MSAPALNSVAFARRDDHPHGVVLADLVQRRQILGE